MKHRFLSLAVVAVSLATACGSRAPVYERVQTAEPALPPAVRAVPAYEARLSRPIGPAELLEVNGTDGVAVAATVSLQDMRVRGPAGRAKLRVAAVDPLKLRSVAPPATAGAEFVWTSLLVGEAVLSFEAAKALGVKGAETVTLPGGYRISVGAIADNGSPDNFADVLVGSDTGAKLGIGRARLLLVGTRSDRGIDSVGKRLRRALPRARLKRLSTAPSTQLPQPQPRPVGLASGGLIGTMHFVTAPGGFISPDPAWVSANIAAFSVPLLGTVECHRVMAYQLRGALAEIESESLASLIRPGDYGGCFVPRFIDRDPSNPLSMHAFGLAIDLNVSTNRLGTRGDMDGRIVAIFERWGFRWGGRWSRPDPMHFELASVIQG